MRWWAALLFSSVLAGCDPHYVVHLRGKVNGPSGPLAGAWVVPLQAAEQGGRTGPDGAVAYQHGGFLKATQGSPLLVYLPGYRPQVLLVGRDVERKQRGVFFVTEWDESFQATLTPSPRTPGLALRCDSASCEATLPQVDPEQCSASLVVFGSDRVWSSQASPGRPELAGAGAGLFRVPIPAGVAGGAEALLVDTCVHESGTTFHVALSDPAPLPPR